jgi:cyclophilin family peptidyl-prolyl cis-trans isomerase
MKTFFEIEIGDKKKYEKEEKEFQEGIEFLKKNHSKYSLNQDITKLTEEEKSLLEEYFKTSNKNTNLKIKTSPPDSLNIGRIVFQLYTELCPKTCENFVSLCVGDKGIDKESKKKLYYKGNQIHRIEKDFMFQGGDITRFDGSGGASIFGKKFKDEEKGLKIKFDKKGLIAMANSGKNTNSSQFFVTFSPQKSLNGKYVVFGEVIEGIELLDKINSCSGEGGVPINDVIIIDCGILENFKN